MQNIHSKEYKPFDETESDHFKNPFRFVEAADLKNKEWHKVAWNYPIILEATLTAIKMGYSEKYKKSIEEVPLQMGAANIGLKILRANDTVISYISELNNIRTESMPGIQDYINLEDSQDSYQFVHKGRNQYKKLVCSETVGNRIGELAGDLKLNFSCLLPACQLYGYNEMIINLRVACEKDNTDWAGYREYIPIEIKEEIDHFERFLDGRLIDLWRTFRKPEIDFGNRIIKFL